jgi:beta-glucosidase
MTLEEKVGQLNQYNGFWEITGPTPKRDRRQKKYDDLKRLSRLYAER